MEDDGISLGIVLVDNASPNGTGQVLRDKYINDDDIEIIQNESNEGFSRANNKGCEAARRLWNPDLYVVANNDIVFAQRSFAQKLHTEYMQEPFYILGPDILNKRTDCHQSPMGKEPPSLERAMKTVKLNDICLRFYGLTYPLMRLWFRRLDSARVNAEEYDIKQENVLVQGACVVFAREYIEERGCIYSPETFFFSEEAIFTNWCRQNNKRIVYEPALQVIHNESASTRSEKDMKRRIRFQMSNILDSTRIYIQELERCQK